MHRLSLSSLSSRLSHLFFSFISFSFQFDHSHRNLLRCFTPLVHYPCFTSLLLLPPPPFRFYFYSIQFLLSTAFSHYTISLFCISLISASNTFASLYFKLFAIFSGFLVDLMYSTGLFFVSTTYGVFCISRFFCHAHVLLW